MKLSYLHAFALFCLLLGQCGCGSASVAVGFYAHKDHPGKCYISADLILAPGEKGKDPKGCSSYQCGGANGEAEVHGCSVVGPPEHCRWTELADPQAAFPLCCLRNFHCDSQGDVANAQGQQNDLRKMFTNQVEK